METSSEEKNASEDFFAQINHLGFTERNTRALQRINLIKAYWPRGQALGFLTPCAGLCSEVNFTLKVFLLLNEVAILLVWSCRLLHFSFQVHSWKLLSTFLAADEPFTVIFLALLTLAWQGGNGLCRRKAHLLEMGTHVFHHLLL